MKMTRRELDDRVKRDRMSREAGWEKPEPGGRPGPIIVKAAAFGALLLAAFGVWLAFSPPAYDADRWRGWSVVKGPVDGCTWHQNRHVVWEHSRKQEWTVINSGGTCILLEAEVYFPYLDEWRTVRPSGIDVDHRVSLAEAHRSGGWRWNFSRRREFANDPGNLVPTLRSTNRAKADTDPGGESGFEGARRRAWWPTANRCEYAKAWRETKRAYGLAEDDLERAAIEAALRRCATDAHRDEMPR